MTIGIIGLGRLGSALLKGLYKNDSDETIYACNRTKEKSIALKSAFNQLHICDSETEVIECSDIVFMWVKPDDAKTILEKNAALISGKQSLLISCTLNIPLHKYTDRWAECYPNINMSVSKGVTVIHYAPSLSESDHLIINGVLKKVGSVYPVSAEDLPYYSALSSCGPALYAAMLESFADTMSSHKGFDPDICRRMVIETVLGTLSLQDSADMDSSEIVYQVAHPGGSSEAGVRFLRKYLPEMYENMLKEMKKW